MRILFVSIEYPPETPDGIGSYVAEIGPALVARGHDVHVLSCLPGQLARDYVDRGVHVHRRDELPLRGLERLVRAPKAAERIRHALTCVLEASRLGIAFDVVEAADWMAEGLGFAMLRSAPLVVHLHTPLEVTSRYTDRASTARNRMAAALEKAAARRANLLTSPSRRLLHELAPAGWLEGKDVRVVRLPIAARPLGPPTRPAAPTVLCVGRLEPLKAPDLLVEAAARLRGEIGSLEVVFVGRSAASRNGQPYGAWLESYARELGAPVRLAGEVPRPELEPWYRDARVVVVPSRHENLPYAGLEALACGRPVVCRATSGLAELLDGSGAGAVVRGEGPQPLADALRPFLEDGEAAARAASRALELVERHCSPAAVAAQREACYRDAIESWRARRASSSRRRSPSGTAA